jgi:hypothetical protein
MSITLNVQGKQQVFSESRIQKMLGQSEAEATKLRANGWYGFWAALGIRTSGTEQREQKLKDLWNALHEPISAEQLSPKQLEASGAKAMGLVDANRNLSRLLVFERLRDLVPNEFRQSNPFTVQVQKPKPNEVGSVLSFAIGGTPVLQTKATVLEGQVVRVFTGAKGEEAAELLNHRPVEDNLLQETLAQDFLLKKTAKKIGEAFKNFKKTVDDVVPNKLGFKLLSNQKHDVDYVRTVNDKTFELPKDTLSGKDSSSGTFKKLAGVNEQSVLLVDKEALKKFEEYRQSVKTEIQEHLDGKSSNLPLSLKTALDDGSVTPEQYLSSKGLRLEFEEMFTTTQGSAKLSSVDVEKALADLGIKSHTPTHRINALEYVSRNAGSKDLAEINKDTTLKVQVSDFRAILDDTRKLNAAGFFVTDMKPANVQVKQDEVSGALKLTVIDLDTMATPEKPGSFPLTPYYMPGDVAASVMSVVNDFRVDLSEDSVDRRKMTAGLRVISEFSLALTILDTVLKPHQPDRNTDKLGTVVTGINMKDKVLQAFIKSHIKSEHREAFSLLLSDPSAYAQRVEQLGLNKAPHLADMFK